MKTYPIEGRKKSSKGKTYPHPWKNQAIRVTMSDKFLSIYGHFWPSRFRHKKARRACIHEAQRAISSSIKMVRDTGFEPVTPAVSRQCSTTELTAPSVMGGHYRQLIHQLQPKIDDAFSLPGQPGSQAGIPTPSTVTISDVRRLADGFRRCFAPNSPARHA